MRISQLIPEFLSFVEPHRDPYIGDIGIHELNEIKRLHHVCPHHAHPDPS
jgi:hypothetical protein